jgi:hypothetical protein
MSRQVHEDVDFVFKYSCGRVKMTLPSQLDKSIAIALDPLPVYAAVTFSVGITEDIEALAVMQAEKIMYEMGRGMFSKVI